MTKPAIEKPVRRKANPQSNSIAWAVLGAAGLGYLGIAFFAPQILPDFSGGRAHQAETTVAKFSGEIESMQLSLRKLETDMDRVKSDVAAQANQTQSLSSQVSALDEKISTAQAPAAAPSPATADAAPQQPSAGFAGLAAASGTDDAAPAPAPKIINSPRVGAPIETGSVNSGSGAPIAFGPAVVKPTAKPVGIQIAQDPSVDGLRVTWGALSQIHPEELGRLKARYADIGTAAAPNFGLIAGPVKSKAEAKKLCKALAAQNISCKVSDYRGEEL
ncbi:SPOR domain-containing protein [Hyphomicrobium sp.]|uniref:SPOR domain-containing protein n=1 Tax=Hyphomicrobium sp. TaxID=82 RepID=UPI000FA7B2BB|nr:SPOR domain-containing protein [Hyphomicrobium sp.]RUO97214.1 MAG: SPOR domain-containing protein [Hyphomicrobium sp.]